MKAIIGIDPGKSGALAVIFDGNVLNTMIMPVAGNAIDINALAIFIHARQVEFGDSLIAYIEKVGAMPGQGVTSMFSFGFSTGIIHGILGAYHIPTYIVAPQTWKKVVLADTKKDKDAAIQYCRRVYPNVSLLATERCKKPHDGLADSICIATHGCLTYVKSNL